MKLPEVNQPIGEWNSERYDEAVRVLRHLSDKEILEFIYHVVKVDNEVHEAIGDVCRERNINL